MHTWMSCWHTSTCRVGGEAEGGCLCRVQVTEWRAQDEQHAFGRGMAAAYCL